MSWIGTQLLSHWFCTKYCIIPMKYQIDCLNLLISFITDEPIITLILDLITLIRGSHIKDFDRKFVKSHYLIYLFV